MVCHGIFWSGQLSFHRIRENACSWFKSYLKNRTQICSVTDSLSKTCSLRCGIPRWIKLGPLGYYFIIIIIIVFLFFYSLGYYFWKGIWTRNRAQGRRGKGTFFLTRPKSPGPSPSNVCHACTC